LSKIEVNTVDVQCGSTLTLGSSGKTVTLATGASQSGFGRTGTVDWCTTAKTSPFTSVSGKGYFVNTTSGSVTVTLPSSPSAGDIVSIADYAGTSACNAIIIGRNGSKFQGTCNCGAVDQEREALTLVYVDGTQGWQSVADNTEAKINKQYIAATGGCVSTVGDFKIHVFNASSNFVVSSGGNSGGSNTVDYLVVAGGGAGSNQTSTGNNFLSGGGGGGGYRESSGAASGSYTRSPLGACVSATPVTAQTYPVTVGGGAASGSLNGTPSVFSTITSTGGGSGGAGATPGVPAVGQPGGSGGGGHYGNKAGGTGNTPPVSPAQGTNGGTGVPATSNGGGGGGGATAAGANANPGAGAGGAGATSEITNSPVTRAGGGGGGSGSGGTGGAGGSGGGGTGGAGQTSNPTHGAAGTVNTGGGAGGSSDYSSSGTAASAGGSGVVVIRYKFQN
jgi:hypothetical protein